MSGIQSVDVLLELTRGYQISQILYAVTKFGIADQLKSGAKSGEELAQLTKIAPSRLIRLLRAATALGIIHRNPTDLLFSLNEISTLLIDGPASLKWLVLHLVEPATYNTWSLLDDVLENNANAVQKHLGVSDAFQYYNQNPVSAERFNKAMTALTTAASIGDALTKQYDFKNIKHVVDVGGNQGTLLVDILRHGPHLVGTNFDLPEVIEQAKLKKVRHIEEVESRLSFAGGSFFDKVPSEGDLYLLKFIIHDWDDEKSIEILKTVSRDFTGDKKLLIIDLVVGDIPDANSAILDLHMLILNNAQERSEGQFQEICNRAGLKINRFIPLSPTRYTAVECVKQ